ncbi:MAG: type II secretion system F family protein [Chloroflexi bacterium]|nr:type II secretion system F family protein [Chloroflexota bacterium]
MPYKYVAYDANDNLVKGLIDVTDQSMAEDALANAGYTIVNLTWAKPKIKLDRVFPSLYGIKQDDVINFSRQMATLIEAGLTIPSALQLLEKQITKPTFQRVIVGLREELEAGSSFSQALTKYPEAFPSVYCHIAEAGEQSGDLAEALKQAVEHMERSSAAIKKAKRAMVYPSFVLIVAMVVVVILITVVLPPLMDMFTDMDAKLPITTRVLMSVTDFCSANMLLLIGGLLGIVVAAVVALKRPAGQRFKDKMVLRLPVFGQITLLSNMALFSRTSSTLMSAGVPLTRIMDIVSQTATNSLIRDALKDVQEGLVQGHGLSKPMAVNKIFPNLLVQMVTVGEQTGTLDTSLKNTATFYESEVNHKVDAFTSVLEPMMTVGIALFVGFIALSVITPMYSIMGSFE